MVVSILANGNLQLAIQQSNSHVQLDPLKFAHVLEAVLDGRSNGTDLEARD